MAINLQKGQRIDLTKGNEGLKKIIVGLGWDPVKKGFFGIGSPSIDCDASAILLNAQEKIQSKTDVVYFGNLKNANQSVIHSGDNLTGEGEGDDEQIIVHLDKIEPHVEKIVFVVNIYDAVRRKQDFGLIENAFIRVVDDSTKKEILRYNLSDNYAGKTALMVGEIYKRNNEWKFAAIGEGTHDASLSEIVKRYT